MDKKLKMLLRNSKYKTVDRLRTEVAKLITSYKGYGTKVWDNFEPHGLYRARQHNHLEGNLTDVGLQKFTSELEFWNNPAENCTLGRCNDVGESIFYCSNEFEVAIQEIKPWKEYITTSVFCPKPKQNQTSTSHAIPIGIEYLAELPALEKFFKPIEKENIRFEELDSFLNYLFYNNIIQGNSHLYKLSTAIFKNMMSPIRNGTMDIPMQGLVYSSMARDKKGFNIAFKPGHVISNYYIYGVQTHKVLENTDKAITIQLIRNGEVQRIRNSVSESSDISWYEPLVNGEIFTFEKK